MAAVRRQYDYKFNAKRFGATGNGSTDDTAAIQACCDAAEAEGVSTWGKGAPAYLPNGNYKITAPLRLNRTTHTPTGIVPLIGESMGGTQLVGSAAGSFNSTTAGGVVMWDATTQAAWGQRIANLTIVAPGIDGVRCVYHRPNATISNTTTAVAETLQIDIENVYCVGSNRYQDVLVDFGIGVRFGSIRNLYGDPFRDTVVNYQTLLLQTAYQYSGAVDPAQDEDGLGLCFCTVDGIHAELHRGGWCRAFKGRLLRGTFRNGFYNGARAGSGVYGWDFRNSTSPTIEALASEGGGEARQFSFNKCYGVTGRNFGIPIGTPTASDVAWVVNHPYSLGDRVVPTKLYTPSTPAPVNRVFTCTTAGTSHATTEPTWADTGTTADNTVVWTASTEVASADGIVLESCENCNFDTHFMSSGSSVPSYRLTKAVSIDDNCRSCKFTNWTIRGVVTGGAYTANTDVATEVTLSATAKGKFNSISGDLVQSFNDWRNPYSLGVDESGVIAASATYDPASLSDGVGATTTLTATGAAVGDFVEAVAFSNALQGVTVTGWVSATDTVSVRFQNESGGTIDLASGTLRVRVRKAS